MSATQLDVCPDQIIPAPRPLPRISASAKNMVHNYPGTAYVLAPLLRKAPHSLLNEVNPNTAGHKLGLEDAVRLMLETRDYTLLHEINAELNHAAIYLGDYQFCSDTELIDCYASFHAEVGDMAREVAQAMSDRRITREEVTLIRAAGAEMIRAHLAFLHRLDAIAK